MAQWVKKLAGGRTDSSDLHTCAVLHAPPPRKHRMETSQVRWAGRGGAPVPGHSQ